MKSWWLVMALLLSVGINIGILVGRGTGAASTETSASGGEDREPPVDPPAGGPRSSQERQAPRFIYRLADELRLRGETRDAFIDRQRRFLEETLAARARFGELQGRLRRELTSREPDRAAADALLREIGEAHAQLERAFVENLFDTRELLGPEQQRRYLHFLQRFRQARDGQALRRLREEFQGRPGPPPGRGRWAGRDRDRDG